MRQALVLFRADQSAIALFLPLNDALLVDLDPCLRFHGVSFDLQPRPWFLFHYSLLFFYRLGIIVVVHNTGRRRRCVWRVFLSPSAQYAHALVVARILGGCLV